MKEKYAFCPIVFLLPSFRGGFMHRVHTERQFPISGVHPIMMEQLALAGEGWGCTSTPFYSSYHHVQKRYCDKT